LVSPDVEAKGKEHADFSISVSGAYQRALLVAGGLPLSLPATTDRNWLAESIRRSDGLLLTGGDDVEPRLYTRSLPAVVRKTVEVTPDGGQRDLREFVLIDEAFRQHKPLLAICRGHQVLNVALGGTLIADIPRQKPAAANHRRTDRRSEVVHEVRLTPGSLLANITRRQRLGVNSTHHQAVGRVAAPLRVTARSPDGIIEGLELKPGVSCWRPWLLSVQFHPERLVDRYPAHQALFDAFVQACALSRDKKL
jgi:putative glutamine amidotransferase